MSAWHPETDPHQGEKTEQTPAETKRPGPRRLDKCLVSLLVPCVLRYEDGYTEEYERLRFGGSYVLHITNGRNSVLTRFHLKVFKLRKVLGSVSWETSGPIRSGELRTSLRHVYKSLLAYLGKRFNIKVLGFSVYQ